MDAVEYLKTLRQMCKEYTPICPDCPAFYVCGDRIYYATQEKMAEALNDVEAWKEEHPVKTRIAKLLEVFPNADVQDGFCDICPKYVEPSYKVNCNEMQSCTDCGREYWTEEIE